MDRPVPRCRWGNPVPDGAGTRLAIGPLQQSCAGAEGNELVAVAMDQVMSIP